MKKFTINCDFGGQMAPFAIYIGKPEQGHHPLHFQSDWLSKNRGGMVPGEVMEAITQLQELAEKNGVILEDLCVYALGTKDQQDELEETNDEIDDANKEENDEDPDMESHVKHEIETHEEHSLEEEEEDMSSEGGHIQEENDKNE